MNKYLHILITRFLLVILISIFFLNNIIPQDSMYISSEKYDSLQSTDTITKPTTKSGYDDLKVVGGANSVNAELKSDDGYKHAWIDTDWAREAFTGYYNFKRNLKENLNIAVGIDYMFLNQYASFSYSEKQANSGIFRFFGTWLPLKTDDLSGSLIFKIENRHKIGHGLTPRNLGYEAGSALSTASFKVAHE